MKHLIKKNKWECLLYSIAMATGFSPNVLVKATQHDGSELVEGIPGLHKGWHIQEFILALAPLYSFTPIDLIPVSRYKLGEVEYEVPLDRNEQQFEIAKLIVKNAGVITGWGAKSNTAHAVAFKGEQIYDPDGPTYTFDGKNFREHQFRPQTVWLVR